MKRFLNRSIYSVILGITILSSCASYNYSDYEDDKSFKIKTDDPINFEVYSNSEKIGTAIEGYEPITLEKLKKENLSFTLTHPNYEDVQFKISRTPRPKALIKDVSLGIFTFGIPVVIDLFNSDFYKVSNSSKEVIVHFEFKQSFMIDEYEKIKLSTDPAVFEKWISNYGKSSILQDVIDHKDSLELSLAISRESEKAIDDYISTHQSSNYLKEAEKLKSEMILARQLFEKSKIDNTVAAYENFLSKFPRSIHNTEAHKRLIDVAEKEAFTATNSVKIVNYISNYFLPNLSYLTESEIKIKKSSIIKSLDAQIIKENIKSDPKKTYEYYSNLWKSINKLKNEIPIEFIINLEQVNQFKDKIYDQLFVKLKESTSSEKQTQIIAKINTDFPNLDLSDPTKNPIISILEGASKSSGILKLYNVNFLGYYFDNISERSPLKGIDVIILNGTEYHPLQNVNYEEISFVNGQLSGLSKCYSNTKCTFSINLNGNTLKEVSYYVDGKLTRTVFYPQNRPSYFHEFENGINLTLKYSNEIMSKLSSTESLMRKYISNKNYNQAMNEFNNILPLLKELPSKAEENPIPEGLEKWLPKVELLGKIYSEAATKKEESNLFSTNNRYIKPTDLNFNFVDNRKICSCCSSNYCMYEYLPQNNIEYQKVCLSVDCNIERMYMHWKKMGSSEEQMHRDLESFKGYLSKTYTGFQYSQLYSYALVKLQLTQQLQDYANVVGAITGEKMTGLGGLKRDVNLFETKSKYCGNRCANDYRCQ